MQEAARHCLQQDYVTAEEEFEQVRELAHMVEPSLGVRERERETTRACDYQGGTANGIGGGGLSGYGSQVDHSGGTAGGVGAVGTCLGADSNAYSGRGGFRGPGGLTEGPDLKLAAVDRVHRYNQHGEELGEGGVLGALQYPQAGKLEGAGSSPKPILQVQQAIAQQ
eukprot:SM000105S13890  [mRNA]  locus=s105:354605:355474:+ [translate_table: standard]